MTTALEKLLALLRPLVDEPMSHEHFFTRFREIQALFHAHWADAVDRPGYKKADWRQLDNELLRVWREQATMIGIPKDTALLSTEGVA